MGATPPRPCTHLHAPAIARTDASQYDVKSRRTFLKRMRYDELKPELLYIGSTVTVYSRQLKVVDYGDEFTRSRMAAKSERRAGAPAPWGCQGERAETGAGAGATGSSAWGAPGTGEGRGRTQWQSGPGLGRP